MSGLLTDLRGAWRLLRRHRGLSVLIIVAFALGVGANTAIFAVAQHVLLQPLPYADPDRLFMIWEQSLDASGERRRGIITPELLLEWRTRNRSFESVAALESWQGNLSAQIDIGGPEGAERLRGALATPNFFSTLGVTPALGRAFVDDDPAQVVVLSDRLWRRLFAADPTVIGQTIDLSMGRERVRTPFTIVGVLPERFRFTYPEDTELWLPLKWSEVERAPRSALRYWVVARLRADVTLSQAQDDMAAMTASLARERPIYTRLTVWLESVHDYAVGRIRPALRLLAGVTLLVFVVACINVASLLLAQTTGRRREIAVQLALGASRKRIVRQLVTESALTAAIAGIASTVIVAVLQPVLRAIMPPMMPRVDEIGLDLLTVAWTTALVALSVGLATVVPGWRGSAVNPSAELTSAGRSATDAPAAGRWRQALVTAQMAIVSVLLIDGGMLLHSFWKLQQVDLGYDGTNVLTAEMRLLGPRYSSRENIARFQEELLSRVRGLPDVTQVSMTSSVPFRGVDFRVALSLPTATNRIAANQRQVDPEYFSLMRILLLSGRLLSVDDTATNAPVAVVSDALARLMFPGESPVGKHLPGTGRNSQPSQIVGVVGDVRHVRVEDAGLPAFYVSRAQEPVGLICLVVRIAGNATGVRAAIRDVARSIDPEQPVMKMTTLDAIVSESIADRRFYAMATLAFACLTLVLAALGLHGVTSYGIAARTREIGVRAALGAEPRQLVTLLVSQGVGPLLIGVALGVLAGFWSTRLIRRFLFGVGGFDPATYVLVAVSVFTLGMIACLNPARRASRLNPVAALHHD